jgi:shikimate dehydrogenase
MSDFIKVGLVGHPVSHSKSPLIHNYWIRKYGLQGEYSALDVRPDHLKGALDQYIKQGYAGLQFTLPHKELMMEYCDEIDETASKVGAVNTIVIKNGKISGTNTDVFGFVENIQENVGGFDFAKGPAVVLGAGGAAHAIVYALQNQGVPEIRLLNRTYNRAQELAEKFKDVNVIPWEQRSGVLDDINFLVNTTSLGLEGQLPLDIDLTKLNTKALVHDIVYAPLETPLLKKAQYQGNQTVTGIGMLLHQARPAFKKWFGVLPDTDTVLTKMVQ